MGRRGRWTPPPTVWCDHFDAYPLVRQDWVLWSSVPQSQTEMYVTKDRAMEAVRYADWPPSHLSVVNTAQQAAKWRLLR